MKNINLILLNDKEIADPEVVAFIVHCMVETGGIQQVGHNLMRGGFGDFYKRAYSLLDVAKKTHIISMPGLTSVRLSKICSNIVGTLEDYHELETLMCLTSEQAWALIDKI